MRKTYISAIPKKKKSPLDLESQRVIFLVNKIRSIFMKLAYNSEATPSLWQRIKSMELFSINVGSLLLFLIIA